MIKEYCKKFLQDEDVRQIETEAIISMNIKHPYVVQCIDYVCTEESIIIVFEYISGISLREFAEKQFGNRIHYKQIKPQMILSNLDEKSPNLKYDFQRYLQSLERVEYESVKFSDSVKTFILTEMKEAEQVLEQDYESLALELFVQLLQTIQALHDAKIMHRDLNLGNVMLSYTEKLHIKLIDFGQSKQADLAHTVVGTPGFMAPELMLVERREEQIEYSTAVDCWSLGGCLYQLMHGHPPVLVTKNVDLIRIQAARGLYLPVNSQLSQLSKDLIELMLQEDPAKRMTCAQAVQKVKSALLVTKRFGDPKLKMVRAKVMFLGDRGVGKSTVIKTLARSEIYRQTQAVFVRLQDTVVQLEFVDTLGLEGGVIPPQMLRGIQLFVVMYDSEQSYLGLNRWRAVAESKKVVTASIGMDIQIEKPFLVLSRDMSSEQISAVLTKIANTVVNDKLFGDYDEGMVGVLRRDVESSRKGCC